MKKIIFFDTETTGTIPRGVYDPFVQTASYPRVVQISWSIDGKEGDFIVRPDGFTIPDEAAKVHGITTDRALAEGVPYKTAFLQFWNDVKSADALCAHNAGFDMPVIIAEYVRMSNAQRAKGFANYLHTMPLFDTMKERAIIDFVGARFPNGNPGKFPRLEELYARLFNGAAFPAHNSMEDVRALEKCFLECRKRKLI